MDKVASPPKEGCFCKTCNIRRRELWLMERLQRELYGKHKPLMVWRERE